MGEIVCDDRGRVLLSKDIREEYGEKFILVKAPGELVLIPIPEDPLKDLQELGKKIPKHLSVRELKEIARETAVKDIADQWEALKKKTNKKK